MQMGEILETSREVSTEQLNITRLRRCWASHDAGLELSLVLEIVGILVLIFIMLLWTPG